MKTYQKENLIVFGAPILWLVFCFFVLPTGTQWTKILDAKPEPVQIEIVETDSRAQNIQDLAKANGFNVSKRIVDSILRASNDYQIDALELTAIAIVETGLGKYTRTRKNQNGTHDKGLFQINTVNWPKCVEYNLESPEGSSLCAAKLLSEIKAKRADYLGVYHSKTPTVKAKYLKKVAKVLASASDK